MTTRNDLQIFERLYRADPSDSNAQGLITLWARLDKIDNTNLSPLMKSIFNIPQYRAFSRSLGVPIWWRPRLAREGEACVEAGIMLSN